MEYFDELQNMAVNAAYEDESDENTEPNDSNKLTIRRLQDHGYTYEEAAERAELIRTISTSNKSSTTAQKAMLPPSQARKIYALKLDGPLSTPQNVQIAANLPRIPEAFHGNGEEGEATFCRIDGCAKVAIEIYLTKQKQSHFRPLFVPEGKAYKELSQSSIYPTLGEDATLPHHRPQDPHLLDRSQRFGRLQDRFPVWYFFYGTLASVPKLRGLFGLEEEEGDPVLLEASVKGGRLEMWGEYNALVDGDETSVVRGSACMVMEEEHEDALRKYETDMYEAVRCKIEMEGKIVEGCTFRFCGKV